MKNFITHTLTESRRMRKVEYVTRFGEMRVAYKMLDGKPEGIRSPG
jgi:hypothetical protein